MVCLLSVVWRVVSCVIAADLLEANVICILAEATTAHVEAILTDHTVSVVADTAGGKEKREREK